MAGFDQARHIKYWWRCRSTFLPSNYTASESSRPTLAYFIVSALDLLSAPAPAALTSADRAALRIWVLGLQHPDGGFCGGPTHARSDQPARGSANLAATFFALLLLAVAAEDGDEVQARAAFAGVERRRLLRWLRSLQRPDGSFGQVLWHGEAVGGRDLRHSYLASCVRWMLGAGEDGGEPGDVNADVDVESMVSHIRRCQTYDGGLAETSEHESHAGYAYCGIAALYMLDRPTSSPPEMMTTTTTTTTTTTKKTLPAIKAGIANHDRLFSFLAHRQFEYLASQEAQDDSDDENLIQSRLGHFSRTDECAHVGYNGRCNKKADTCYCWWVSGALAMIHGLGVVSLRPSRNYMLDVTQHAIGGFSKAVGDPPDIFHSYLGLASLALLGEPHLKELDAGLCCSKETARKVELARQGLLEQQRRSNGGTGFDGDGFWESVEASRSWPKPR